MGAAVSAWLSTMTSNVLLVIPIGMAIVSFAVGLIHRMTGAR